MSHCHEGIWVESQNKRNYFEVAQTLVDSYVSLGDSCQIVLRSPFWGDGLLSNTNFREAFMNIINRNWVWIDISKLPSQPILLKHEHELPYYPKSQLFIRKGRENKLHILRLRYFMWMSNRIVGDTTVILAKKWESLHENPGIVYMPEDDFWRFIQLLAITHKIQLEKYQQEVDALLSIFPPL